VNGRAAAVAEKPGWPGELNFYRVDILPRETGPGLAKLDLWENGIGSAAAALRFGR
jgi:hypothetical protein